MGTCGNGFAEPVGVSQEILQRIPGEMEECDGDDFRGKTCESLGKPAGRLLCDNCGVSMSACGLPLTCGNGILDPGEDCDPAGTPRTCRDFGFGGTTPLQCKTDCTMSGTVLYMTCSSPVCGNGFAENALPFKPGSPPSEACDSTDLRGKDCMTEGFAGGTLGCKADCSGYDTSKCASWCGNGTLDPWEPCDHDKLGGITCELLGHGPGVLGCTGDCLGFDTSGCDAGCGNSKLDPGETCDGSLLAGKTCQDLGFADGTLACATTCDAFDTSGCTAAPPVCGNGKWEAGETCDGPDLHGGTCAGQGFVKGTLACAGDCLAFDTSGCTRCGNNLLDGNEECDGTKLGHKPSCAWHGYKSGAVGCKADCTYDLSGCKAVCGNGMIEPGESCDGTQFGGKSCGDFGFSNGTLTCATGCTALDPKNCTNNELVCNDQKDNNGDGLVDCKDPTCNGLNGCEYGAETTCLDGVDNDADGLTDCLDPSCASLALCKETACADGLDNDRDGAIDCKDPDCDGIGNCVCVRYVNVNSTAENPDGLSWSTAFKTVQSGVDAASARVVEMPAIGHCGVWVAAGTYFLYGSNPANTDHSQDAVILRSGVHVYGGFVGTETSLDQRDVGKNLSVLHGAAYFGGVNFVGSHFTAIAKLTDIRLDGLVLTRAGRAPIRSPYELSNATFTQNTLVGNAGSLELQYVSGSLRVSRNVICGGDYNQASNTSGLFFVGGWGSTSNATLQFDSNIVCGSDTYSASVVSIYHSSQFLVDFSSNVVLGNRSWSSSPGTVQLYARKLGVRNNAIVRNAPTRGFDVRDDNSSPAQVANNLVWYNGTCDWPSSCELTSNLYWHTLYGTKIHSPSADNVVSTYGVPWNSDVDPRLALDIAAAGTWTTVAASDQGLTATFTDDAADFKPGALRGAFLRPSTRSGLWYLIRDNTEHAIVAWGATDKVNAPVAKAGDVYSLMDLHLRPNSPLVDAGNGANAPAVDLYGSSRFDVPTKADAYPCNGAPGCVGSVDIGPFEMRCGDGLCGPGETLYNCHADCKACGDGYCADRYGGQEDACSCAADCAPVCGDGCCTGDETACACPADCQAMCGDGCCGGSESAGNCVADCGTCGDGNCAQGESACSCPADCPPECGDECCSGVEDALSCSGDCGTFCGDGFCAGDESAALCPADCVEHDCSDGKDDDADGKVDCLDDDCFQDAKCPCVRFVKNSSTAPTPDGLTWASAFPTLQPAIDSAFTIAVASHGTKRCEVWIAQGTFVSATTVIARDRIDLLGGFSGTETSKDQRDPAKAPVILSPAKSIQSPTVLRASPMTDIVLDGLVFENSFAINWNSSYGTAVDVFGAGSTTLRNCTFSHYLHSALYTSSSGIVTVEKCRFEAVRYGIDYWAQQGRLDVRESTFLGLRDIAIASWTGTKASISNSTFSGNSGRCISSSASTLDIQNCLFTGNSLGSAVSVFRGTASITNSTFVNNLGSVEAPDFFTGTLALTNSIAWNSPLVCGTGKCAVTSSVVQGGFSGLDILDADPKFVDAAGGNYRLASGSPCLDKATTPPAPATDLEGNPRVDLPGVANGSAGFADIGAYERTCGDGKVQGTDKCDGTDLAGATCTGLGFTSGSLACTADCKLDTTGCNGQ